MFRIAQQTTFLTGPLCTAAADDAHNVGSIHLSSHNSITFLSLAFQHFVQICWTFGNFAK